MRRWLVGGLVFAAIGAAGCGGLPGAKNRSTTPAATAAQESPSVTPAGRFRQPADPCAAIPADKAQQFKLYDPEKRVLPGMDSDPTTGSLVGYDFLTCDWKVDNPAKGPNGKPNWMSFSITYMVIDPAFPATLAVAKGIYDHRKDKLTNDPKKEVKRTETPAGLGDEAIYTYAVETGSVGPSGVVNVLVVSSNACVSISFSAADLHKDPKKKEGFQLYTTPVAEERLRPAVMAVANDAMQLLG
jgi:hypothetical protein